MPDLRFQQSRRDYIIRLPDNVILADNVNQFKNRLDKHWKMHDIVFNYRADLLKSEVWHEFIRVVKIKRFKWLKKY